MSITLAFTLAAMASLAPERNHDTLGRAIAERVDAEAPVFADDADRKKTAALMLAVAWREGSFGLRVEGDRVSGATTSWCTMQVNLTPGARTAEGWTGPELRDDPAKCVAVGFRILRYSVRSCSKFPVAVYASGPGGCANARAQRISADRMQIARRLIAVAVLPAKTAFCTPSGAAYRPSPGATLNTRRGHFSTRRLTDAFSAAEVPS